MVSKRRTWRWVTLEGDYIDIWPRERPKPKWDDFLECWVTNDILDSTVVDKKEFSRLTGLKIPTGRPVKVEFTARILED